MIHTSFSEVTRNDDKHVTLTFNVDNTSQTNNTNKEVSVQSDKPTMSSFTYDICAQAALPTLDENKEFEQSESSGINSTDEITQKPGSSSKIPGKYILLYKQNKAYIKHASGFSVEYRSDMKLVTVGKEHYLLYPRGTDVPSIDDPSVTVLAIPFRIISCHDTTSSAFCKLLNISDKIAFASNYVVDPFLQSISKSGNIAIDPSRAIPSEIEEQEKMVDAFFYMAPSDGVGGGRSAASDTGYKKSENAVLARAEWIKFMSVFFDCEMQANKIFEQIEYDWHSLALEVHSGAGPTVAWISCIEDKINLHFCKYKQNLVNAAGGKFLDYDKTKQKFKLIECLDDNTLQLNKNVNNYIDMLPEILEKVDVVIDETYYVDNYNVDLEVFINAYGFKLNTDLPFLTNKKVFRLDKTVSEAGEFSGVLFEQGLDWFETAVARPDLVLKDFLLALEAPNADRTHECRWLRNIAFEVPEIICCPITNVNGRNSDRQ